MTDKLPDVWATRDYPVLIEVTRLIDAGEDFAQSDKVAETLGLNRDEVKAAFRALERRGLVRTEGQTYGDSTGFVRDVAGAAYLITGLHPDGDDLAQRLISVLEQAANATGDEEDRGALKRSARALGNVSGGVLSGVLTAWISQQTGMS